MKQRKKKIQKVTLILDQSNSDLSFSPQHLGHSEHEGVVEEEAPSAAQEVRAEAPPQSAKKKQDVTPPLLILLLQQVCIFCRCTRPT